MESETGRLLESVSQIETITAAGTRRFTCEPHERIASGTMRSFSRLPHSTGKGNLMKSQPETSTPSRRDRLIHERVHDPYKTKHKLPEPSVCPVCKAVFRHGRWQWAESWPMDARQETCQACHRVKDDYPAGVVRL